MSEGDTNAPKEASPAVDTTQLSAKPTLPQRLAGAGILGGSAALGVLLSGDTHQFDPVTAQFALDPAKVGLVAGLAASGLSAYPLRVFEAIGAGTTRIGRVAYSLSDRIRRYAKNEAARVGEPLTDSDKVARRHGNRRIGLGIAAMGLLASTAAVEHYVWNPTRRFFGIPMSGVGKTIDDQVASTLGANEFSSTWNTGQRNNEYNLYHITQGVPQREGFCSDIPLPPKLSKLPPDMEWDDYTALKNKWKQDLEQWAQKHSSGTRPVTLDLYGEYGCDADPLFEVSIRGLGDHTSDIFIFIDGEFVDSTYRFDGIPNTHVHMTADLVDDNDLFVIYTLTRYDHSDSKSTIYVRDVAHNKGYGPFVRASDDDIERALSNQLLSGLNGEELMIVPINPPPSQTPYVEHNRENRTGPRVLCLPVPGGLQRFPLVDKE